MPTPNLAVLCAAADRLDRLGLSKLRLLCEEITERTPVHLTRHDWYKPGTLLSRIQFKSKSGPPNNTR